MARNIDHFLLEDIQNNDYKSEKKTYRYFTTFEEPFNCSEVYSFTKGFINHLISINYNTFKTISVYTTQRDENIRQIYHLSTDFLNNTIKNEKFTEDIEISPPFDIYAQVETFNIPILFTQNTVQEVLRPTFKIEREFWPRTYDGSVEKRLYFSTKIIESGEQTKEEVYNLCIPYLTNFQRLYKKDRINDEQITKSCYEITLYRERDNEAIYYCEIDTEGDYIDESRIYERLNPVIRKPYRIQLVIYLICNPNHQPEMEELDTQTEIEELEERLQNLKNNLEEYQNRANTTNKCTKEETCCICLINPSNVLLTDCGHLCICENCNKKIKELKCPLCRTIITQSRIIIN